MISGDVQNVCDYALHDKNHGHWNNESPLQDGGHITYTLDANERYSTYFVIHSAAEVINVSDHNFTTFDVQQAPVKLNSDKIEITGEFINNSLAKGLFVVLQCDDSSPDQFRTVMRNESEQTVSSSFSVPPSNYSVYVYDLEENLLPNQEPAVTQSDMINADMNDSSSTNSTFLKTASISLNGSKVLFNCEVADNYTEATCLLVYREYNQTKLEYQESGLTDHVTIDESKTYTFAVFGKNGVIDIDERPTTSIVIKATPVKPTSGEL